MIPRLIRLLPLMLLPMGAFAEGIPDVSPQPLRSLFSPPNPDMLYMADSFDVGCEKVCPERFGPADFPRVKNGRLTLPSRYDLSEFDAHDRALLERALQAAHRYADVNTATADGYVFQKEFVPGMGIHMNNLSLILAKEMDAAKPQFLTYARSRDTGAYHLLQVGYIRPRKPEQGYYPLFHAKAAQGHFHPEDWCVSFSSGVFVDSEAPCAPGTTAVGPIWMMHVTPSLYSQDGMFSDYFSCANHISRSDRQYSFFGAPQARSKGYLEKRSAAIKRAAEVLQSLDPSSRLPRDECGMMTKHGKHAGHH